MTLRTLAPVALVALGVICAFQPSPVAAQPMSDKERLDNICRINPDSALCTARAKGVVATEGLDLASHVKAGEQSTTSPVTTGEFAQCWATWVAIRERIAQNGRETFPEDYTVKTLDGRIAAWRSALVASAGGEDGMQGYAEPALEQARAQVAGPKIILAARMSGSCKTVP